MNGTQGHFSLFYYNILVILLGQPLITNYKAKSNGNDVRQNRLPWTELSALKDENNRLVESYVVVKAVLQRGSTTLMLLYHLVLTDKGMIEKPGVSVFVPLHRSLQQRLRAHSIIPNIMTWQVQWLAGGRAACEISILG